MKPVDVWNSTIWPLQTSQKCPKITVSGMSGPKIHPHGLSLHVRVAASPRMPLACLTGQKTQNPQKKEVLVIFGPRAPSGPMSLFPSVSAATAASVVAAAAGGRALRTGRAPHR